MRERSVFFLAGSDLADDGDDAASRSAPAKVRLGPRQRRGRRGGLQRCRQRGGIDIRVGGAGLRVPTRLGVRGCHRRLGLGLGVHVRGLEGWPAGRNLAGDKDVAAIRDVAGGGEEEILGEAVRVLGFRGG
jgi:hypothetical protein